MDITATNDILWRGRPAARRYFLNLRLLAWLIITLALGAGYFSYHGTAANPQARHALGLAAAVSAAIFLVMSLVYYVLYRSLAYAVHRQGIEFAHGILRRDQRMLLWNQLRSVDLERSLLDRLMMTGSIRFSTGEILQHDTLRCIHQADQVYRTIQQAMAEQRPVTR